MTLILLLLCVKHFVADFPLQRPYQYLNKGTYGHLGGLLHAFIHAAFTAIILPLCGVHWELAWYIAMGEYFLHYHLDWGKMNLTAKYGWSAFEDGVLKIKSDWYFIWLGIDQLLHQLTYVAIAYIANLPTL